MKRENNYDNMQIIHQELLQKHFMSELETFGKVSRLVLNKEKKRRLMDRIQQRKPFKATWHSMASGFREGSRSAYVL